MVVYYPINLLIRLASHGIKALHLQLLKSDTRTTLYFSE